MARSASSRNPSRTLTFANFRMIQRQSWFLEETDLAELALPALGVVGAIVADSAT